MVRKIISYILSFLLVVLIIAIVSIESVNSTILNKKYVQNKLEKSNYYGKLAESINDGFENYIMQSGMDNTIFNGLYDEESLKSDFGLVLDSIYDNKELELSTNELKEKLHSNIVQYAEENNIPLNISNLEQIENFENTIISTYTGKVIQSSTAIGYIKNAVTICNKYVPIARITIWIVTLALLAILLVINLKEKRRILKYLSIILISIGGMIFVGIILEKINLGIENLIILNENLTNLLNPIISAILRLFCTMGGISIAFRNSINPNFSKRRIVFQKKWRMLKFWTKYKKIEDTKNKIILI